MHYPHRMLCCLFLIRAGSRCLVWKPLQMVASKTCDNLLQISSVSIRLRRECVCACVFVTLLVLLQFMIYCTEKKVCQKISFCLSLLGDGGGNNINMLKWKCIIFIPPHASLWWYGFVLGRWPSLIQGSGYVLQLTKHDNKRELL